MTEGFGCSAAAFSCNSSAGANVLGHLLQRQPATANKFQMDDCCNRSNDMKMLWDPVSHFTGVVAVALRHMFTSAINDNHIPQGNLDWMCTYTGLKLVFKWEQITVTASDVSSFDPDALYFAVLQCFPGESPPAPACGLGCRWRGKVCAAEQQRQLSTSFPAFQIIYNSDQGSRKVTHVLELINKLNQKFGASVFAWKWIINWPKLLCVTDGDVTHCGCAQPGGLPNKVFALCDIIEICTNLSLF